MAQTTDNRAAYAFKKLLGKGHQDDAKAIGNEIVGANLSVLAENIKAATIDPSPAQAVIDGVAEQLIDCVFVEDLTTNGHGFRLQYPVGHAKEGEPVLNAIGPNIDSAYEITVRLVGGGVLPVLDARNWTYDYDTGIYFQQTPNASPAPEEADLWVYIGTTGVAAHTHVQADITDWPLTHERGGLEADVNAWEGDLRISGGATVQVKFNHTAVVDPGVNDDSVAGYRIGSTWINTNDSPDTLWICIDDTATAAVWQEVGAGGGGFTPTDLDTDYPTQTITSEYTFDRDTSHPFLVTSGSAKVDNLDADLLDGLHGSAYAPLNHVHDAGDITTGDLALARGGTNTDITGWTGDLRMAGGGSVVEVKYNFTTVDPASTDGADNGYLVGSLWVNTNTDTIFFCARNDDPSGAVWVELGAGSPPFDHSLDLNNFLQDDHTQYALLAGRGAQQELIGAADDSGTLLLKSTAHANQGVVQIDHADAFELRNDNNVGTELRFFERSGAGTAYTSLKGDETLSGNLDWILPGSTGNANDCLITDGANPGTWDWGARATTGHSYVLKGSSPSELGASWNWNIQTFEVVDTSIMNISTPNDLKLGIRMNSIASVGIPLQDTDKFLVMDDSDADDKETTITWATLKSELPAAAPHTIAGSEHTDVTAQTGTGTEVVMSGNPALDGLTMNGTITTEVANDDLTLNPNGTGDVEVIADIVLPHNQAIIFLGDDGVPALNQFKIRHNSNPGANEAQSYEWPATEPPNSTDWWALCARQDGGGQDGFQWKAVAQVFGTKLSIDEGGAGTGTGEYAWQELSPLRAEADVDLQFAGKGAGNIVFASDLFIGPNAFRSNSTFQFLNATNDIARMLIQTTGGSPGDATWLNVQPGNEADGVTIECLGSGFSPLILGGTTTSHITMNEDVRFSSEIHDVIGTKVAKVDTTDGLVLYDNKLKIEDNTLGNQAKFEAVGMTADRTFTFPDASGVFGIATGTVTDYVCKFDSSDRITNAGFAASAVATLTGTQTLTNKTIDLGGILTVHNVSGPHVYSDDGFAVAAFRNNVDDGEYLLFDGTESGEDCTIGATAGLLIDPAGGLSLDAGLSPIKIKADLSMEGNEIRNGTGNLVIDVANDTLRVQDDTLLPNHIVLNPTTNTISADNGSGTGVLTIKGGSTGHVELGDDLDMNGFDLLDGSLGADLDCAGFDLTGFADNTGFRDDSGNELLMFQKNASATSFIEVQNGISAATIYGGSSSSTTILNIDTKGTSGSINLKVNGTTYGTVNKFGYDANGYVRGTGMRSDGDPGGASGTWTTTNVVDNLPAGSYTTKYLKTYADTDEFYMYGRRKL